ncbi:MAG: cation diffusion facilitator family transporter [Candidatus Baltobacteraceae bacterium]
MPLRTALVLTIGIALLELGGGILSHSLALLSDTAHVFMDAFALGIALAASVQAARPATARQSYGFARIEVLAALANGGLLFAVTVLIAVEAVRRFASPEVPHGALMSGVAALGLAVNVGIGLALARGASENLNVKAALFHVASDVVGAFAVVIAGLVVLTTGAAWVDPAASLLVAAIIVVGVVRIAREAADVLLESAPAHAEIPKVRTCLRALDGVVDVHDLHVWTIAGGQHVLSAHVLLEDKRISEASAILRSIETCVLEHFGVTHVTIQFECESCAAEDRIVCTQR